MIVPIRALSAGIQIYIDGTRVEKFKRVSLLPDLEQNIYYLELQRKIKRERYLVYDLDIVKGNLCIWCTTGELA